MAKDAFSQQEIETIVDRAFDGEKVQVLDHRLVSHSKEKVGFLGDHQNLELSVKRSGSDKVEELRFFVKGQPHAAEEQMRFINTFNLFGQEAIYFNEIKPLLKKCCAHAQDWCPKSLLANDRFIVLEDMRLRGYAMSDSKLLNGQQLRAAFRAQARLHAASLLAEKRLGKSLQEAYPKGCSEIIFTKSMIERGRIQLVVELVESIARRLGLDARRIAAGFHKGFHQMYDQRNLNTTLPKVLGHGDAWPNNYLFDGSDPSSCVMVDFQLTRYGPRTCDLALLCYLGTSRDLRRAELRPAIEAYHQQLCEMLQSNDPEIARPTLDEILHEFEQLRFTAFYAAALYYPFIWVGKSTSAKYDERELYKKLMFREDNTFAMQVYDEDKTFSSRINELVEEVVEYFEKHDVPIKPNTSTFINGRDALC